MSLALERQSMREARRGDLAEARLIAASQRPAVVARQSERSVIVTSTDPRSTEFEATDLEVIGHDVSVPRARSAWFERVVKRAAFERDGGSFTTTDPSGVEWSHAAAHGPDGRVVVVQRRAADVGATTAVRGWVALLCGLVIAQLAVLYVLACRRLVRPLERVLAALDDLRVRGELRPQLRAALERLPRFPIELGEIGTTVVDIEHQSRRDLQRLDSLLTAASVLGGSLRPERVADEMLEIVEATFGVERAALLRFDARFESSSAIAIRGHPDGYDDGLVTVEPEMPSMRAIAGQEPVQIADVEAGPVPERLRERGRRLGFRSVIAVPLPPILESPTVLMMHRPDPYRYSFDEVELARTFAAIAAAALRNAEAFARTDGTLQSRSSQLRAIVESVDEAILVETRSGRLLFANSRFRELAELPQSGSVDVGDGVDADGVIASIADRAIDPFAARTDLDRVRSGDSGACDVELHRPGGDTATWRVHGFDVTDALQFVIGRGMTWTDVTADRELDRMRAGLLATVSHEFRAPLALIKGYATTLLADDVAWRAEERIEFLANVVGEADRLTSLVQSLLDMRRIDAGMVELTTVDVALADVVAGALPLDDEGRGRVDVGPLADGVVEADEVRLATALRNLIVNALRYSPADERVEVAARPAAIDDRPAVAISVVDRGPGIPAAHKERIFDTFVRADDGAGTPRSGIGLGLSISRGFVVAHGGFVTVADREGGGSVFEIVIPRHQPAVVGGRGAGSGRQHASRQTPADVATLMIGAGS